MPPTVSARMTRRRRARFGRREIGAGVERADRRPRRARGVVVVQLAVGAVVDVAGRAFVVEVVERPQQEVAFGLERVAIDVASRVVACVVVRVRAARSRSTTSSSSAVAASRGVVLQRRTANTIPAPPSTSASDGMPQATMPMPPFDGVNRMCSP